MKQLLIILLAIYCSFGCGLKCSRAVAQAKDPPPPVFTAPPPPEAAPATGAPAAANPAPPPSAPVKRSAADLEKLVAPIALYPDSLIATLLMASVYPLEIVQAARFVADTNNLANLDAQPWDENVKAVARVPAVIKKMNDELSWTMELGDAFLAQDKEVMDTIQDLRGKAQKAGTLQTTPQQIVTVTNMVVEKTIEQQVVVVTNTVVQIQPSSSTTVYVPTYNPYTVYYPPPAYYANPYPLLTFGAGMAMGAIIANNCNWYGGGCYHGNVNVNINNNYNRNTSINTGRGQGAGQKWQPDQSRLGKSGSPTAANSARSMESRGWGSGGAGPSAGNLGARPSTGNVGARPSTGNVASRPSAGTGSANRPSASSGASRPTPSSAASRPSASPSASPSRSSSSAFGGVSSGASDRSSSNRGAASRSSSGGGGFSRSGGGGGGGGFSRGGGGGGRGGGRR